MNAFRATDFLTDLYDGEPAEDGQTGSTIVEVADGKTVPIGTVSEPVLPTVVDIPEPEPAVPFEQLPEPKPCPQCGGLDKWWDILGGEHCTECEASKVAKCRRLAERAAELRRLHPPKKTTSPGSRGREDTVPPDT
jgi:hypothetical protein